MFGLTPTEEAALGALASLNPTAKRIFDAIKVFVADADKRAREQAAKLLLSRISELHDRIDDECVNRVEFADLCKNCTIIARRTCYEEKLRAAANILGNALLRDSDGDKLSYAELDHFTRCVEHLSLGAIQVLGRAIVRGSHPGVGRYASEVHQRNVRFDFGAIAKDSPEFSHDLLMGLLGELNSFGLIHLAGVPGVGFGDDNKKYENYPVETTPLGYRFKKHVLDPGTASK